MKPAHWTAVLILALMVGGISFVTVYLGGSSRSGPDQPGENLASLTFPIKKIPQEGEKVLTTEVRQTGHQDFWFVNESGQDVAVGLNDKGCTCSEVEITVAPPSWRTYLVQSAVMYLSLPLPMCGLEGLALAAALNSRDHLYPDLPDDGATTTRLTRENSVTVPAGALGRARLSWRQEQAKPLLTYANLWMGQRGGSVYARLDVGVQIAEPVKVAAKELSLPAVTLRELENKKNGKRAWIYCWSLTRRSFPIKAESVREGIKAESDPVEMGEPVPLDDADIRMLENRDHMLTILSGYKIPVTLKARAKDATPIEWGLFRRFIRLSTEEGIEPVLVQVTGEVLGDITIGGGKGGGTIDLGPFPRKNGTHGNIILQTDEANLDLELDTSRVPEYLRASLSKLPETAAGHRSWVLRVTVPPNAARGEFPRADNSVYRDSAIYVKTTEKPPRSIRVPVMGTANEG